MPGQRWYPNLTIEVPPVLAETARRTLDFIYELRDDLGPQVLAAHNTEDVTVGTDTKQVTGCQLTLGRRGLWLIGGVYTIAIDGDAGQVFTGTLRHQGETRLEVALLKAADSTTAGIAQFWVVNASPNDVVALEITKDGGAGTSSCPRHHSTISAVWGGRT